jgi:hypothetical protein
VGRAQDGWTPLHIAAALNGHASVVVVSLLLERGANKEAKKNVRRATQPRFRLRRRRPARPRACAERRRAAAAQDGKTPMDVAEDDATRAALRAAPAAAASKAAANSAHAAPAAPAQAKPPAPAAVPSLPAGLRPSGPKVALCIGISAYESPINTLANPVHDAGAVAAALKQVGYDTSTLFHRAATKKGMRQALEAFSARLGRGGVAFFFFAGHGMTGLDGKNYLLPVNGIDYIEDLVHLEDDALSLEKVNKLMEGSGCFLHIVAADACRSLPSLRSRSRATQTRGMSVCSAAPAEVGSLLAYSCDLGKTASDGEGRNGVFTTALLRHLTTPNLHVENVFTRAARDCQELTKHKPEPQRPWKAANLTHEHVCLF